MIDLHFSEIDQMHHLLVLIGGNSWDIQDQNLYRMIDEQLSNGLPVAAICGAVDYLAFHGF